MSGDYYLVGRTAIIPTGGNTMLVPSGAFSLSQWKTITDFAGPYDIKGKSASAKYEIVSDDVSGTFTITSDCSGFVMTYDVPVTAEFRAVMHGICMGFGVHFW